MRADSVQPPPDTEPTPAAAGSPTPSLPRLAGTPLPALAAGVALLRLAARPLRLPRRRLYFLVAAHHLAWGYPTCRRSCRCWPGCSDIAPGSLVLLRLPSALAAGATVVLTALTCRARPRRPAQLLAAAAMAVSPLLLAAAHLFGTTPLDLLFWTLLVYLVVHILRSGDERLWLAAGPRRRRSLNKDLVAFLAVGLLAGLVIAGPRRLLASPWLWAGALIAGLLWTPYLVWQAQRGWPKLAVAHSIAAGRSGTSEPRWAFLPYQFLLIGPVLAPVG